MKLITHQQIAAILKCGWAQEHVICAALRNKFGKCISGSSCTARIRQLEGVERRISVYKDAAGKSHTRYEYRIARKPVASRKASA